MPPRAEAEDDRRRRRGDRAVSSTVGFVLVLGFLLVAFTMYQGIVVPEQNRHAEFDHSQSVQSQVIDLRSAVGSAATGAERSASIEPGADYPRRTFAYNLGSTVGQVRTQESGSGVLIENVTAIDDETADYFGDGSTTLGPYETKSVRYEPNYLWYTNAPTTVYENTVAYNRFDDGTTVPITDQTVVDGRRITLVAVNGSLTEAKSGTVTVDVEALSASSERVAVTNVSGGRLNVTVPTDQSAAEWRELLADEMNASPNDGRYVEAVRDAGDGRVSIVLTAGVTYDLRLAKVGVGSRTAEEDPHYVTDVSGDGTSIAEGGAQKLVVEVRDRFNNPVSGVVVESSIEPGDRAGSGDTVSPPSDTTGADGRASFTYEAPNHVDGAQLANVTVSFNSTSLDRQNVIFNVSVLDADGSGIDPGPPGKLAYDDANGNGEYDSGETTYTKSDLEDGFDDTNANLVVPSDVGTLDPSGNKIAAESITLRSGIESSGDQIQLTADDDIDVSGQEVTTSGEDIQIRAGEDGGGLLTATNANVATNRHVDLRSDGGMYIDGATVSAGSGGDATADLQDEDATFYVDGAAISDRDDTLEYQPEDVSVSGSPSSGSVSDGD